MESLLVGEVKTFKHSGDLGDIIFSLPAIRATGGGVLFLDPDGGAREPVIREKTRWQRTKLTANGIESLKPLLMQQPYIKDVRHWTGELVDYNLDKFREHLIYANLSDSHLAVVGAGRPERDRAWLTVSDPIVLPQYPMIISRSVRYAPNYAWWSGYILTIKDRCAFVGYPEEHQIFEYTMEVKVPYLNTPDVLTLARVIAGCTTFVGNASLPHALAEGMKKRVIVELCRVSPNVMFIRPDAQYM